MLSYLFSGTMVVKWHIQLFTWKGRYEHEEKPASHIDTNNVNSLSDAIILYQFAVRYLSRNAINVFIYSRSHDFLTHMAKQLKC